MGPSTLIGVTGLSEWITKAGFFVLNPVLGRRWYPGESEPAKGVSAMRPDTQGGERGVPGRRKFLCRCHL